LICKRAGIDPSVKASRTTHAQLNAAIRLIVRDEFRIQKLGGYEAAMVTAGGVSLSEINLKSMESTRYPNLFFAGEVLDVDGDTGGYNLQFAFSSGHLVSQHPEK
jgi:predicted flavoprotein YhiN